MVTETRILLPSDLKPILSLAAIRPSGVRGIQGVRSMTPRAVIDEIKSGFTRSWRSRLSDGDQMDHDLRRSQPDKIHCCQRLRRRAGNV